VDKERRVRPRKFVSRKNNSFYQDQEKKNTKLDKKGIKCEYTHASSSSSTMSIGSRMDGVSLRKKDPSLWLVGFGVEVEKKMRAM
jgi:hypothetical protein